MLTGPGFPPSESSNYVNLFYDPISRLESNFRKIFASDYFIERKESLQGTERK